MNDFILKKIGGIEFYQSEKLLKLKFLVHAFTTKKAQGKEEEILKVLKIQDYHLVSSNQVHGDKVAIIDEKNFKYKKDVDALITDTPGVALAMFYADCVPIFLFDKKNRVCGLIHAGWRGSLKSISGKTIKKMKKNYLTHPEDCYVAIFPSIRSCCYEVDENFASCVKRIFKETDEIVINKQDKPRPCGQERGKWFLDLTLLNRGQIIEEGVPKKNISVSDLCTRCNALKFFSYRREGENTGRMTAIIALRDETRDF